MRKHPPTVAQRKARLGRLFILPFTLGFLFFFLQPLLMSLYYSLSIFLRYLVFHVGGKFFILSS